MLGNVVLRKAILKPFEYGAQAPRAELDKYFQSKHVLCLPICKLRLDFEPLIGRIAIVVLGKDGRPKEALEVYAAEDADCEFADFYKHFISIQLAYCKYFYSFEHR